MKLLDILKMIDKEYDFEADVPVKDYDIRPSSVFKICLCFMSEEETWVTVPATHPILRQYYYAEVHSFYPEDNNTLAVWLKEKDWFPLIMLHTIVVKKEIVKPIIVEVPKVISEDIKEEPSKKPKGCIECPHCDISYSSSEPHQADARCLLCPTARTKGKLISWAMDTCQYLGGPITPGVDRIKENLKHRQRHAPKWCPLFKEDKDNG